MIVLYLILLIVACVCFGVAAFASRVSPKVNLVAAGLLAFVLVPTIQTLVRLGN